MYLSTRVELNAKFPYSGKTIDTLMNLISLTIIKIGGTKAFETQTGRKVFVSLVQRMGKNSGFFLRNIVTLGAKLFANMFSEVRYVVWDLLKDLKSLFSETQDCKKFAYLGKIFYKGLRIAKLLLLGAGMPFDKVEVPTPEEIENTKDRLIMSSGERSRFKKIKK